MLCMRILKQEYTMYEVMLSVVGLEPLDLFVTRTNAEAAISLP